MGTIFDLDLSLFSMAAEAPAEPVPEGEANEVCGMTRDTNQKNQKTNKTKI